MVGFRNVAGDAGLNDWWDNGSNQIAFCRGNRAFIAINNDIWNLNENLQVCYVWKDYFLKYVLEFEMSDELLKYSRITIMTLLG